MIHRTRCDFTASCVQLTAGTANIGSNDSGGGSDCASFEKIDQRTSLYATLRHVDDIGQLMNRCSMHVNECGIDSITPSER